MDEIKTLFQAASEVEIPLANIEDAIEALRLWHEKIENSGYQNQSNFDNIMAIRFVKNEFPGFLFIHRVLVDTLMQHIIDLRAADNAIYEAARKERAAEATK